MPKSILWSILLVASFTINAQSISLLTEGNPWPDDSIKGQGAMFEEVCCYI